jgi:hypothetical protein
MFSGESIAEVNKVMQGHADGDLTEIGYIQSQVNMLKNLLINFFFLILNFE